MADYIDRDRFKIWLTEQVIKNLVSFTNAENCLSLLDYAPRTDVAEVKRGKWEELASGYGYKCSVCGAREKRSAVLNKTHTFCYKCGAKMYLEEGENNAKIH